MPAALLSRDEVVARIQDVFRDHGFDGASLAEISKATGLGKSSLYHYFPGGKDEMAVAVLARIGAWMNDYAVAALKRDGPPKARLRAMLRILDEFYVGGRNACVLGNLVIGNSREKFQDFLASAFEEWIGALRALAVEAGVQITGTALAPIAKLTSTPNVPDTEKLSWLVLGHGLAASNKSDYALLTSAAAGLLGSSDSASIQSRIAATLGVDEIGVSGIGGTNGGLLTVGKQISSRLRVTFEQGFTKAATLIKARYNIYKRIDLQVQTGTESAIDIFYTFTFD